MEPYYQDDWVTLYHGDCLELAEVWTCADVLVTDPPYGIRWSGIANYVRGSREDRATRGNESPIAGDENVDVRDAALAWWGDKPAIVFGSWRMPRPQGTRHRLIWWKRGQAPGPTRNAFVTQDEEIYILGSGWPSAASPMRSVIDTSESRSREVVAIGHPTPKPVGLMERLLERCPPGSVADPFSGSGATLLAARNLGRRAVGVELEEKYCELTAKRLDATPLPLLVEEPEAPATVAGAFDLDGI